MKEVLGCYKINNSRILNEDSQALIYECSKTGLGGLCCARVINKQQNRNQNSNQFKEELQVLEQLKWLRHENIQTIYDYKEEENFIYQFAEQWDSTLLEYMNANVKISRIDLLEFIKQISAGYLELIKSKIKHIQLKPDNILIKNNKEKIIFKISGFKISKLLQETNRNDTRNLDTQLYSSPEMLDKDENCSYESDIFSFGLILYQLITGNVDICVNSIQQKEFFDSLQKKSFKQYINENKPNNKILVQILDLIDKLIVYDPQKRINWNDLNQLASDQFKDYLSFLDPISQQRDKRTNSQRLQPNLNLKENQNFINFKPQKEQEQQNNFIQNTNFKFKVNQSFDFHQCKFQFNNIENNLKINRDRPLIINTPPKQFWQPQQIKPQFLNPQQNSTMPQQYTNRQNYQTLK